MLFRHLFFLLIIAFTPAEAANLLSLFGFDDSGLYNEESKKNNNPIRNSRLSTDIKNNLRNVVSDKSILPTEKTLPYDYYGNSLNKLYSMVTLSLPPDENTIDDTLLFEKGIDLYICPKPYPEEHIEDCTIVTSQ